MAATIRAVIGLLSPWPVYACDFRLISAATCALPMAAHTTRAPISPGAAEHAKRVARRNRIVACERERTILRNSGEPEPKWKC